MIRGSDIKIRKAMRPTTAKDYSGLNPIEFGAAVRSGNIPVVRNGSHDLFLVTDIDAYLATQQGGDANA